MPSNKSWQNKPRHNLSPTRIPARRLGENIRPGRIFESDVIQQRISERITVVKSLSWNWHILSKSTRIVGIDRLYEDRYIRAYISASIGLGERVLVAGFVEPLNTPPATGSI